MGTSVGVAGWIRPLAASLAQVMAVMSLKRGTAPSCLPGTPHGRSTGLGMAALVPCPQPQSTLTWGEDTYIHRACWEEWDQHSSHLHSTEQTALSIPSAPYSNLRDGVHLQHGPSSTHPGHGPIPRVAAPQGCQPRTHRPSRSQGSAAAEHGKGLLIYLPAEKPVHERECCKHGRQAGCFV